MSTVKDKEAWSRETHGYKEAIFSENGKTLVKIGGNHIYTFHKMVSENEAEYYLKSNDTYITFMLHDSKRIRLGYYTYYLLEKE